MKILIIGASSFIGFRLFQFFKINHQYKVIGTYFQNKKDDSLLKCDITNKKNVENILKIVQPDVILWVAGSKNLKLCEEDLQYAKEINTFSIQHAVNHLKNNNLQTKFIFFSTDYVFAGDKGGYKDLDIPSPKTNYGLTNYLAEQILLNSNINYTIVRTSAVMGEGGTFFDWLRNNLLDGKLELFNNIYFSPTPIQLLLDNILNILVNDHKSTLHICGHKKFSRYDFAVYLKNLRLSYKADLIPIASDGSVFQHDLSLEPSTLCIHHEYFDEYLFKELFHD